MDKFIEEINKLSANSEVSTINTVCRDNISPAIDSLYGYAECGVNILAGKGITSVNIHRIHVDLIPLFFHFETSGGGFVISNSGKYVFFMQSADKKIFIYGMTGNNNTPGPGKGKMQQLLNIDFVDDNGKVIFYDSTNKVLQPDEIVLLTLSWALN